MKTIKEIVANKAELIALKKAEIKTVKGGLSTVRDCDVLKSFGVNKDSDNELERTIIGNTYLWMDSHDDVHAKGCFAKTIKERSKSVFHLHDHEFKITSKVGEPIKIYENAIKWQDLGVNKEGITDALFMDTKIIKDYNNQIFNEYKSGRINQHSVGMQYVKIDLAVNDEEFEEEYKAWQDNIDNIGNKDHAEAKGYFWLVREAKLIEISAVLLGSNELTPTINEPLKSTQKKEAEKSLQKANELLTKLKF
ncbi:MAG: hypothetical protein ACPGRW_06180 [Flavobacteriaceae bacterium]